MGNTIHRNGQQRLLDADQARDNGGGGASADTGPSASVPRSGVVESGTNAIGPLQRRPDGVLDHGASTLIESLLTKASYRGILLPSDDALREHTPFLWSLLTQDTYRDGTERVLPTIVITRTNGGFLITLQDHASHQKVEAETLTLGNAWWALEQKLAKGGDEFKPYKSYKVKDPLKRKKRDQP